MATALASLVTGRLVRSDVAMTGEITLRGRVLPVGGLKEKVLTARRAGLKTVIIPRRNEKDLVDLPRQARKDLRLVLVDHLDDVLKVALNAPLKAVAPPAKAKAKPAKPKSRLARVKSGPAKKILPKPAPRPASRPAARSARR
jgi:ATP-dependent Lon protease